MIFSGRVQILARWASCFCGGSDVVSRMAALLGMAAPPRMAAPRPMMAARAITTIYDTSACEAGV